jgi:transcriptional regulator with XRE-family HTH domain
VQLADGLAISQPQLASYEVGRRRVPVSMLPRLAKLLSLSVEALIDGIGDDGALTNNGAAANGQRRTRRGPPSRTEQQLDAIAKMPKSERKIVNQLLDAMIAQHAAG